MIIEKMPPYDLDNEQSVIGSCLIDECAGAKALEVLPDANDFYKDAHKIIYAVILDLLDKNKPTDLRIVSNELKRKGKIEEIGGNKYLTELIESFPTSINVAHYANIVKEKAVLRNLINAGQKIISLGYQEDQKAIDQVEKAELLIRNIMEGTLGSEKQYETLGEVMDRAIILLQEKTVDGIPTRFYELDDMFNGGFDKKKLYLLAARPSLGKSSLGLLFSLNMALEKYRGLVASIESDNVTLFWRILAQRTRIENSKIRRRKYLSGEDIAKLTDACNPLYEIRERMLMADTFPLTTQTIRRKARKLKREGGLDYIIVDHFHILQDSREKGMNDVAYYTEISKRLKEMARELDVVMICLAQLNREVEGRVNKKPQPSDLRGCGGLEENADGIIFIHRPDFSTENPQECEEVELLVAKNRDGAIGTVKLFFQPKYVLFTNPDKDNYYSEKEKDHYHPEKPKPQEKPEREFEVGEIPF